MSEDKRIMEKERFKIGEIEFEIYIEELPNGGSVIHINKSSKSGKFR